MPVVPVELHLVKRGRSLDKWFVTTWHREVEKPEGWTIATDFRPFVITGGQGKNLSFLCEESPSMRPGVVAVGGCPRSEYDFWQSGLLCLGWEERGTRKLTREEAVSYTKRGAANW